MAADKVVTLKPARPCPICGKPASQNFYPFCSKRCADIDLNRWLTGTYVIPGSATDQDPEADDAATPETPSGEEDE